MAFANGTTVLHLPIAASAGASLWGTDVRKLNLTADATQDATTVCNLGTGGTVRRTCDPYTTSTADLNEADYGWAITPSDMGSVAGATRFYAAGNHTLFARTNASVAFVSETKDFIFSAYRVGPAPTRTRTLLGSATVAMNLVGGALTVALALPEIVFAADETIQYSFEMNAGGIIVTGRTVQFQIGTTAVGESRIETPSLETLASTVGSATGSGAGTAVMAATGAMAGSASGSGAASAAFAATGAMVGSAAGAGAAVPVLAGINTSVGAAAGVGAASAAMAAVGVMAGAAAGLGDAAGAMSRVLGTAGAATGVGTATGALVGVGAMVGSSTGVGAASGSFGAVSEMTGIAAGIGSASGEFAVVAPTVGTVNVSEGGGETVVRPMFVFDD